jgi:hypothetical protein
VGGSGRLRLLADFGSAEPNPRFLPLSGCGYF